jgi:DHA3 family macrolide efflux protein-like MFS transporter
MKGDSMAESNFGSKSMKPCFVLWGGQAVSALGSQVVQFGLIWWLTIETSSAAVLATASIVGLLPQIVLGPFIGAAVDRWNRKFILFSADSVTAIASLILAYLFYLGSVQVWQVYVILLVRAVGTGFHVPTMTSTTSLMVPKEQLTRVQGLNQTLSGGLLIVAAPLGAVALELLPMQGVLAIDVLTALFAVVPLLFIAIPQPASRESGTRPDESMWESMRFGFRYVRDWPGLVYLLVMSAIVGLAIYPAFSLLPLLVSGHFAAGALQLGWLNIAFGIGVFAGGIALSIWGGFKRRILTALVGLLGLGAAILGLGLAPASALALAIVAMFALGAMIPLVGGPLRATLQATVPADIQGRVFTLLGSLESAAIPLGLVIVGTMAGWLGVRTLYLLSGVTILVVGTVAFFVPAITQFEGRAEAKILQG